MIPLFSNTLGLDELRAVREVFASRWLGRGKKCAAFELEFAAWLGADRVLLCNCCTAATYLALQALSIPPGSEIIISTINFVGCANAVIDCGYHPVFADCDERTLNILPEEIERLRTPDTAAVLLLHYGGHPAPMDKIQAAADGLILIEDAANAVASQYQGQACGTLGDAGVWSFDAMKILVMGDGGALWLRDDGARKRAEALRYLGFAPKRTSGTDAAAKGNERWWEYDLVATSGRYTSNDIAAAMGRLQLEKLPAFVARRKEIWQRYQDGLADLPQVRLPPEPLPDCEGTYYLYWIQTEQRDQLARYLYENDVYTTFRYYPLHLVRYYESNACLPHAEQANEVTLNLPLHQNLSDSDVDNIIFLIHRFYLHDGFLYD